MIKVPATIRRFAPGALTLLASAVLLSWPVEAAFGGDTGPGAPAQETRPSVAPILGLCASDVRSALKVLDGPGPQPEWLALPLSLPAVSPQQGERDLSAFQRDYLDSGLLQRARDRGIKRFVLLPAGVPSYMLLNDPTPAAGGERPLNYEFVPKYALLLGDVLQELQKRGVDIEVSAIALATPHITADQWPALVKYLRAIAQARDIKVKFGAPGWPAGSPAGDERLQALQKDGEAWAALDFVLQQSDGSNAKPGEVTAVGKPLWILGGPRPEPKGRPAVTLLYPDALK